MTSLTTSPSSQMSDRRDSKGAQMTHASIRGSNGPRHEVDFGDASVRVEVYASDTAIEIFVDADLETLPEERRPFAMINIPPPTVQPSNGRRCTPRGKKRSYRLTFGVCLAKSCSNRPWSSVWHRFDSLRFTTDSCRQVPSARKRVNRSAHLLMLSVCPRTY